MAQFIRTRIRCVLYVGKVGAPFMTEDKGETPKIFKGAGAEFELLLAVDKDNPFDVSNISSLTVMAKAAGQPTTAPVMLKTSAALTNIASIDTWKAGSEQHVVVVFSGVETNIAQGLYDLTVYGVTSDDGLDTDVFGTSTLQIIDAGLNNTVAPPVGASPAVTLEQVQAMLEDYVTVVRRAGVPDIYVSPDGTKRRIVGIDDNAVRIDSIEDAS